MLRASSLGLSYPLPTIFALHSCRRLCGARSSWASRSRHASSSSGNSVLPEVVHPTPTLAHRQRHQRQQQNQPPRPYQEEDASPEESPHVAYAQQHRRLLQMGQADEESTVLRAVSSVSLTAPEEEAQKDEEDGTRRVSSLDSEVSGTTDVTSLTSDSQGLDGNSPPPPSSPGKKREKIRKGPTRPEREVIQNPPSYTSGRPWSADPIARVDIPDKIQHLLRNIENGLNKAHAQYERLVAQRAQKALRAQRRRLADSARCDLDGKSAAPSLKGNQNTTEVEDEVTEIEKPPPLETTVHLREHLDILGKTDSVHTAWGSYTYLIDTISSHPIIYNRLKRIPFSHLHRFVRLLAHSRPRTHIQYLRLLSVMTYIVHVGGTLKQPEWNALIDHIGAGRRKTAAEDMEKALAAFRSMSSGRLPGSSDFEMFDKVPAQSSFEPDVYTMTILLSLAARAHDPATLKQISNAMVQTGIVPNRITHLSLLRYFTEKKDLSGVRRTLQKMRQHGLELGVDGLNACIWAYGNNNRLDVALMIYRALRHNTFAAEDRAADDVRPTLVALQEEHIYVGDSMIPNEISYTALVQVMAYHGQFVPTIKIFIDMLSTDNLEYGAPVQPSESGDRKPLPYSPTIAVYRAVFLGFARHGKPPSLVRDPDELDWTLKNLMEIFDRFLTLPDNTTLTHPVLNIIVTAFVQTSGGDTDVIRQAWLALDERFGIVFHKEHSQSRLVKIKQMLFPDGHLKPDSH